MSLPGAYTLLLQPTTSLLHLVSPLFPAVLASTALPSSTASSSGSVHAVSLADGRVALIAAASSTDGSSKVGVWTMEVQGGGGAGAGGIGEVLFTGERTAKVLIPVGDALPIESQHTHPSHKAALEHPEQQPPFSTLLPRIRQALGPHPSHPSTAEATKALLDKIWAEELAHEESRLALLRVANKGKPATVLPYATAKTLIELLLDAPRDVYPAKLVSALLMKGYFSDHMIGSGGGLFDTFVERSEWDNVFVSMRTGNLPEVREKSVIRVLNDVLVATALEVDTVASTPTLQKTLVEVVRFGVRSEEAVWKEAIGSVGIEGVVRMLEVLDGWMGAWLDGTAVKIPEVDEVSSKSLLPVFALKPRLDSIHLIRVCRYPVHPPPHPHPRHPPPSPAHPPFGAIPARVHQRPPRPASQGPARARVGQELPRCCHEDGSSGRCQERGRLVRDGVQGGQEGRQEGQEGGRREGGHWRVQAGGVCSLDWTVHVSRYLIIIIVHAPWLPICFGTNGEVGLSHRDGSGSSAQGRPLPVVRTRSDSCAQPEPHADWDYLSSTTANIDTRHFRPQHPS